MPYRDPEKRRLYAKQYKDSKPNYHKINNLRRYNLSIGAFNALLMKQNGLCAICHKPETLVINGRLVDLAVDHDHVNDKIRGLLCCACNKALGLMGDNPDRLRAAAFYLERENDAS